jgi:4-amino-4-deoxy-L-arabinose transferase-like glycosyltransferase
MSDSALRVRRTSHHGGSRKIPRDSSRASHPFVPLRHWRLILVAVALCVLLPGISAPTSPSGKDEYLLTLRTPLAMMENDVWAIPELDGAPRLKKPPLIYWLGRASYEAFGPGLASGRLVAVGFALLLLAATAGIARRLTGSDAAAFWSGLVLVTAAGFAVEGRRMMLDVPVAALSASAFWAALAAWESRRTSLWALAGVAAGLGFLAKGPIVAVVAGSGALACLASGHWPLAGLRRRWWQLVVAAAVMAAVALPWFWWVGEQVPNAADVLAGEIEARQIGGFSLAPLGGFLVITAPWAFWVFSRSAQPRLDRTLWLWIALSLAPFLFVRTFERYLIGSIVPLAILVGMQFSGGAPGRDWQRVGGVFLAAVPLVVGLFALWFRIAPVLGAAAIALAIAVAAIWITVPRPAWWVASAVALWVVGIGIVYPALGINAMPDWVREAGAREPMLLYRGPQPALLPILSGRAHYRVGRLAAAPGELAGRLVGVSEVDRPALAEEARARGLRLEEIGSYTTFATYGSGLRFWPPHVGREGWRRALESRSADAFRTRIHLVRLAREPG